MVSTTPGDGVAPGAQNDENATDARKKAEVHAAKAQKYATRLIRFQISTDNWKQIGVIPIGILDAEAQTSPET